MSTEADQGESRDLFKTLRPEMDTSSPIYSYYSPASDSYPLELVYNVVVDQYGQPDEWDSYDEFGFDMERANKVLSTSVISLDKPLGFLRQASKVLSAKVENPDVYPISQKYNLHELNSTHIGKSVNIDVVINNTDDRNAALSKEYSCQECGSTFERPVLYKTEGPVGCGCGSAKTQVKRNTEMTDELVLTVQSVVNPETWTSRKMKVVLHGELARQNLSEGEEITIEGVVMDEPISKDSDRTKLFVVGLHTESYQDSEQLEVTESDIEEIRAIAESDNTEQMMVDSIAPRMVGIDEMKRGALYSLFSGLHDGTDMRTRVHVIYLGDPETGKTSIQKWIRDNIPQTVFGTGGGSTQAGLTLGVKRDEITGDYMIQLGLIPRAHKGYALIDEIDKADDEDLGVLNNPLEDGITTKSSIEAAEVPSRTVVIGAANPKDRVFDEYEPIHEQFGFPEDFTSRFDLIYTPKQDDETDEEKAQITEEILGGFSSQIEVEPPIEPELFAKYLQFARQLEPDTPREVVEYATEKVSELDIDIGKRKKRTVGAIAIASARINLRSEVTEYDIDVAIDVLTESIQQYTPDGEYDSKIDFGYPTEQQYSTRQQVLQIVDLFQYVGSVELTKEEWLNRCAEEGIEREKAEHHVEKLIEAGRVYEYQGTYRTS